MTHDLPAGVRRATDDLPGAVRRATDDLPGAVRRATDDLEVLGLVLSGSRARDGMATEWSDFDVYVVVGREAADRWRTTRTAELDTIVMTIDDFRSHATAGGADEWNRYSFTHARVLLDRLDGEIAALVAAKATLAPDEARELARRWLDAYVNFAYRAAKSRRDGRPAEARLDAAESVPALLAVLE